MLYFCFLLLLLLLFLDRWEETNYSVSWSPMLKILNIGISLVAQWLRIHPAMQGTWVQPLVGELRSHRPQNNEAQLPQLLNCEPKSHNYRVQRLCTTTKGLTQCKEDPECCNEDLTQPSKQTNKPEIYPKFSQNPLKGFSGREYHISIYKYIFKSASMNWLGLGAGGRNGNKIYRKAKGHHNSSHKK